MLKILFLVILAELFATCGHVVFKKGLHGIETPDFRSLRSSFLLIKTFVCRPAMWIGILLLTGNLLIWLMALAQGDLSIVFPLGSVQFILILVASTIFLKERADWNKLLGTLLVAGGIVLVGLS